MTQVKFCPACRIPLSPDADGCGSCGWCSHGTRRAGTCKMCGREIGKYQGPEQTAAALIRQQYARRGGWGEPAAPSSGSEVVEMPWVGPPRSHTLHVLNSRGWALREPLEVFLYPIAGVGGVGFVASWGAIGAVGLDHSEKGALVRLQRTIAGWCHELYDQPPGALGEALRGEQLALHKHVRHADGSDAAAEPTAARSKREVHWFGYLSKRWKTRKPLQVFVWREGSRASAHWEPFDAWGHGATEDEALADLQRTVGAHCDQLCKLGAAGFQRMHAYVQHTGWPEQPDGGLRQPPSEREARRSDIPSWDLHRLAELPNNNFVPIAPLNVWTRPCSCGVVARWDEGDFWAVDAETHDAIAKLAQMIAASCEVHSAFRGEPSPRGEALRAVLWRHIRKLVHDERVRTEKAQFERTGHALKDEEKPPNVWTCYEVKALPVQQVEVILPFTVLARCDHGGAVARWREVDCYEADSEGEEAAVEALLSKIGLVFLRFAHAGEALDDEGKRALESMRRHLRRRPYDIEVEVSDVRVAACAPVAKPEQPEWFTHHIDRWRPDGPLKVIEPFEVRTRRCAKRWLANWAAVDMWEIALEEQRALDLLLESAEAFYLSFLEEGVDGPEGAKMQALLSAHLTVETTEGSP